MSHPIAKRYLKQLLAACSLLSAILLPSVSWSQVISGSVAEQGALQLTVNSSADGPIQADSALTLREAIEVANGTLPLAALSADEQQLISARSTDQATKSEIRFNLPVGQTTIELSSLLPAIARPNLTIDGTTQPGYDAGKSATAEISVAVPIVTLRPAVGQEIFRGLTLSADNITVRGLSLYGFNASEQITHSTPPADIFISHRPMPLNRATRLPSTGERFVSDTAPSGIVIEQNWLGLPPDETMPEVSSGFGVSVFDSSGTTIQHNRIEYHNGSGVITGRQADNLKVLDNIIVSNGLSGMPDAIRLDGQIEAAQISRNLICGNDGSGIFLFKPDGAVTVSDNDIRYNGQRLRRAAVYVMGNDHRVVDNVITHQKGGGVVVTAFGQGPNTQSSHNVITGNRFDALEGLSIDLNARRDRAPQDFQRGDGPNPIRNSHNRRQDTANSAVNAPQFISPEFFVLDGKVVVRGQADPNSAVQLYRSTGSTDEYGPLTEPMEITSADEKGEFEFVLDTLVGGEVLSAIATDPRYGTSEPALNTHIRSLSEATATAVSRPDEMPQCTTPPAPPSPPTPPESSEPIPAVIQLQVPRNVHFALDEDFISDESADVLDTIAAVLEQYPSIIVDLHGHTDSRASVAYNEDLARRRAESARRYLLDKGIGSERMTLRSLGETVLLVEETDPTNFARNRRVEFVFKDVRGVDITFVNQEADLQIEP
jgi:outer membrane protein OmpA-like peptidoglycan-associated protein